MIEIHILCIFGASFNVYNIIVKKQYTIKIEEDLIQEVEKRAGEENRSKNNMFETVIERGLKVQYINFNEPGKSIKIKQSDLIKEYIINVLSVVSFHSSMTGNDYYKFLLFEKKLIELRDVCQDAKFYDVLIKSIDSLRNSQVIRNNSIIVRDIEEAKIRDEKYLFDNSEDFISFFNEVIKPLNDLVNSH